MSFDVIEIEYQYIISYIDIQIIKKIKFFKIKEIENRFLEKYLNNIGYWMEKNKS